MKDIAGFNRFEAALIVLVAAVGLYYFTLGACAGNALFSGLELVAAVCGICSVVQIGRAICITFASAYIFAAPAHHYNRIEPCRETRKDNL